MNLDLTIEQLCGQLIVGGFSNHELPAPFAQALSDGQRGGAILFSRNVDSVDQTQALCREVARHAPDDLPPFIGVDEEGGRVSRLPDELPRLPAMRELGRAGDLELAERAAAAVGGVLAELGFNVAFAPVLDVDSNPDNPVIGDRSFSPRPEQVARLGQAFARGLQSAGVLACGKHFPGHGDTSVDSHLDLPYVAHGRARLDQIELLPFRALAKTDLGAMMSAHVVFSALDSISPATLSRRISTGLLRQELGFDGVLFSDDMEMRALTDRLPIEQSAVQAVAAGCDVLLICRDPDLQQRAHEALIDRAEADADFLERCVQAVQRSLRVRHRFPPKPQSTVRGDTVDALHLVVEDLARRAH